MLLQISSFRYSLILISFGIAIILFITLMTSSSSPDETIIYTSTTSALADVTAEIPDSASPTVVAAVSSDTPMNTATNIPTDVPTSTNTALPDTDTPTNTATIPPTETDVVNTDTNSSDVDDVLIAQGEALFLSEAGGIGCAYCHGDDAYGDIGPNIRGKSVESINQALGTVPQMISVTDLTDEEIEAIAVYLDTLDEDSEAPNPTSTLSVLPSPTPSVTITSTPFESANNDEFDPALIAQGEALYLREAGDIGCAYCHGDDAYGDIGPNIRGKSVESINQALGTVPQMISVTDLTDEEIEAIAAYLADLAMEE